MFAIKIILKVKVIHYKWYYTKELHLHTPTQRAIEPWTLYYIFFLTLWQSIVNWELLNHHISCWNVWWSYFFEFLIFEWITIWYKNTPSKIIKKQILILKYSFLYFVFDVFVFFVSYSLLCWLLVCRIAKRKKLACGTWKLQNLEI